MNQTLSPTRWILVLGWLLLATTPFVLTPTTYDSYLLGKRVWIACLGSLWLLAMVWQGRSTLRWSAIDAPLLAMLGVYTLSVAINYHSALQIQALIHLYLFVGLFYAFRLFWSLQKAPEYTAWILTGVACLLAAYGLIQDYGIDFTEKVGGVRDWRSRVVATLGNPNFLGGYLSYTMPLTASLVFRPGSPAWQWVAASVALALQVACLTVTFCVGATLGLLALLFVIPITWVFVRVPVRLSPVRLITALLVCTSAVSWYMVENPYNSHGRSLFSEAMESPQWRTGLGAREFNWTTTRLMIDEAPLTGIGYANYMAQHIHYQGMNYQRYGTVHDRDFVVPVDQPHFLLLESAAEIGPFGVLVLCWLGCVWIRMVIRRMKSPTEPQWLLWGCYLGVWVALVHSFSSFPFHLPANTLLVVALAAYTIRSQAIPQTTRTSLWKRIACTITAVLVCGIALCDYQSNRYLRAGVETPGFSGITRLETARALNPLHHQVHFMLGVRYIQVGWMEAAERALHTSISLQEDMKAHEYLARLYALEGRTDDAITSQQRVLELNPVFWGHYEDMAGYLETAGQNEAASEMLETARRLREEAEVKYGRTFD